nr:mannonate dehydratase [Mucilaginibacter yixingensis]
MYPSPSNGFAFCTGSLGVRAENDLPGTIGRLGQHIHFLYLRNVQREAEEAFLKISIWKETLTWKK